MRVALAVDGGFREAENGFTVAVEPGVARILAGFSATEVLIAPAAGDAGDVGTASLLAVETDSSGAEIARFAAGRRLGSATRLAGHFRGPFPLQLISDDDYRAILAAAEFGTFAQPDATPAGEMTEFSIGFSHIADSGEPPVRAVLETLRRATGNLCALTGAPLMPDALPTVIRWQGADRLHLNNLLLFSPAADEAFRQGHFAVRDDFAILVDFSRIDPELLEMINPNGRLCVPRNPALRPSPENLAWHRRHIFRLA
jgi:hypothetical protein